MSSILDSSSVPPLADLQETAKLTPYGSFLEEQAELRKRGEGLAHTDAKLRLFGTTEEPHITFYRDTAAWCPYCQKVWILLEEKRIPYRVEKINMRAYGDKPPSFLRLVPSGAVPAIAINGNVMTESMEIMMYLEQTFTGVNHPSLFPSSPMDAEYSRANRLIRLERDLFARWWDVVFRSGGAPAMKAFQDGLTMVNQELLVTPGPWFLNDFSLVDITFASLLERMVASTAYWSNLRIRGGGDNKWPAIGRYFEGLESRRSYLATRGDFYSHAMDLPPQCGTPYRMPGYEENTRAIEGGDWRLPLPPLDPSSDLEVIAGEGVLSDTQARQEAAFELLSNLPAVARFACRASGEKGAKRFQAPLADPYALPDLSLEGDMTTLLSLLCLSLLDGSCCDQTSPSLPLLIESKEDGKDTIKRLTKGLSYLRDRVGVPRDMSYPAARQLRAHLNHYIDLLLRK